MALSGNFTLALTLAHLWSRHRRAPILPFSTCLAWMYGAAFTESESQLLC